MRGNVGASRYSLEIEASDYGGFKGTGGRASLSKSSDAVRGNVGASRYSLEIEASGYDGFKRTGLLLSERSTAAEGYEKRTATLASAGNLK